MEKTRRNERLCAMMNILTATPGRVFPLSYFCQLFGVAKSTLSEDMDLLCQVATTFHLGRVDTVAGAAGGVRYRVAVSREDARADMEALCRRLSGTERVLPGGFLYDADILSDPACVQRMGDILATEYADADADFVLTMETKGIPVAMATARALGVPLVIARRASKVYEGSAVNINYVSGSSGSIQTMSLARRAAREGQQCLIVDDFLRGGGTAQGMRELMGEFGVTVVGMAFVMATVAPEKKRISGEKSLLTLEMAPFEDHLTALVKPAPWLLA